MSAAGSDGIGGTNRRFRAAAAVCMPRCTSPPSFRGGRPGPFKSPSLPCVSSARHMGSAGGPNKDTGMTPAIPHCMPVTNGIQFHSLWDRGSRRKDGIRLRTLGLKAPRPYATVSMMVCSIGAAGGDSHAARGTCAASKTPAEWSRDQFDDPLHCPQLEYTITVSRVARAIVATGVVLATKVTENFVNDIDARVLRVVSEDAFHAMPMAVEHESWIGDAKDLTQPLSQYAARVGGFAAIPVQSDLRK
jgi:hypothetical protein